MAADDDTPGSGDYEELPPVRVRRRTRHLDLRQDGEPEPPEPEPDDVPQFPIVTPPLPDDPAQKVRALIARKSKEFWPYVNQQLFHWRSIGMPWAEIARRFGVHEQTCYKWWRRAREYVMKQHSGADPALRFATTLENLDWQRRRLMTLMGNTNNLDASVRVSLQLMRIQMTEHRTLQLYGYFNVVNYGSVTGRGEGSDAASAESFKRDLDEAFSMGADMALISGPQGEDMMPPPEDDDGVIDLPVIDDIDD